MNREQIRMIKEVEEYIEENLNRKITLVQIAREVGYSPWYVSRLYQQARGMTLFAYIRKRRLVLAAGDLLYQDKKVIDTALDFLFDSHEGFTRAFVREFGVTPSRLKREDPSNLLNCHELDSIRKKEERVMERNEKETLVPVFVQIMEKPARKLLVKRGEKATHYFDYCKEVGCDVWDDLAAYSKALTEPMGLWLPDAMIPDGTSKYVQGVEFDLETEVEVPEGFDLITLDPVDMMLFQGPPFEDEDFGEAIQALWDFIEQFDPLVYGYRWANDKAPRFQYIPEGYRGYIEGLPVEKVK